MPVPSLPGQTFRQNPFELSTPRNTTRYGGPYGLCHGQIQMTVHVSCSNLQPRKKQTAVQKIWLHTHFHVETFPRANHFRDRRCEGGLDWWLLRKCVFVWDEMLKDFRVQTWISGFWLRKSLRILEANMPSKSNATSSYHCNIIFLGKKHLLR